MSKKGKSDSSSKVYKLRQPRYFSDTFKRQRVIELNRGLISVTELSKLYNVSIQSIYKWIHKYSPESKQGEVQVVQMESESQKKKELLKRLADLERIVGQKQLQIDYLEKLIAISSEELKVDLKKSFDTKHCAISTNSSNQKDLR